MVSNVKGNGHWFASNRNDTPQPFMLCKCVNQMVDHSLGFPLSLKWHYVYVLHCLSIIARRIVALCGEINKLWQIIRSAPILDGTELFWQNMNIILLCCILCNGLPCLRQHVTLVAIEVDVLDDQRPMASR